MSVTTEDKLGFNLGYPTEKVIATAVGSCGFFISGPLGLGGIISLNEWISSRWTNAECLANAENAKIFSDKKSVESFKVAVKTNKVSFKIFVISLATAVMTIGSAAFAMTKSHFCAIKSDSTDCFQWTWTMRMSAISAIFLAISGIKIYRKRQSEINEL